MNEKPALWRLHAWIKAADSSSTMAEALAALHKTSPSGLSRETVVTLYRTAESGTGKQKHVAFLSAMVWGYSSEEGKRSDSRGPSRVREMFDRVGTAPADDALWVPKDLSTLDGIEAAYRAIRKAKIRKLGPNFFTKHLYFRGKAQDLPRYPVIFDARVATGLVAAGFSGPLPLHCFSIDTQTKPSAYRAYVDYIWHEAERRKLTPEQLELELFHAGRLAAKNSPKAQ